MKQSDATRNYTVRIREDYVVKDPDKVKEILQRVSEIVSKSYQRAQSA